ncbi:MAG TPA: T9SS type A sorting domain-containing protein [Bacteroidia bacterium]|jgi:hypothetical protein|nr:T9SS type A sorting domain-containing protein [Bacteroidia bacterium]
MIKKGITLLVVSCLTIAHSFGQSWRWGRQGITKQSVEGVAVSVDNNGNSFLTGDVSDTLKFDTITLTSKTADVFVVKYDSVGNVLWAKQSINNSGVSYSVSMASDDSGNVYVCGIIGNSITFDTTTLTGRGTFLVKYDMNGNVRWAKRLTTSALYVSVSIDGKGYPYLLAYRFLNRYDPSGNLLWADSLPVGPIYYQIAATRGKKHSNSVYVTGHFNGPSTLVYGKDTLVCASNTSSIFVIKCDSSGKIQWARQSKTNGFKAAYLPGNGWCAVASDIDGNAFITGYYDSTITFGSYTLPSEYNLYITNMYVGSYDSAGNVRWANAITSKDSCRLGGFSVSVDTDGHVYFCGACGPVDTNHISIMYNSDTLRLTHMYDASVFIQCDKNGNLQCGCLVPSGGDDNNCVASDYTGRYVYFGGDLAYPCIFGADTLSKNSFVEVPFVARWQTCFNTENSTLQLSKKEPAINLFPNPSTGQFTLSLSNVSEKSASGRTSCNMEVYNVLGERVESEKVKGESEEIDLSGQPNGIYLYRVITENGGLVGSGKFVIQK